MKRTHIIFKNFCGNLKLTLDEWIPKHLGWTAMTIYKKATLNKTRPFTLAPDKSFSFFKIFKRGNIHKEYTEQGHRTKWNEEKERNEEKVRNEKRDEIEKVIEKKKVIEKEKEKENEKENEKEKEKEGRVEKRKENRYLNWNLNWNLNLNFNWNRKYSNKYEVEEELAEETEEKSYELDYFDKLLEKTEMINEEQEQRIDTILNKIEKEAKKEVLLELVGIKNGDDIIKASKICVKTCEDIFRNIFKEQNIVKIINMIDTASNHICKLGDAFEVLRKLHNNKNICKKANEALLNIETYIDKINIDQHLYTFLKKKFHQYEHILDNEHKEVLHNMIISMENQGVHIKDEIKKNKYLKLQQWEKSLSFLISSDDGSSLIKSNGIYIEKQKLEKYINKQILRDYENRIAPFISNKKIRWDTRYSMNEYMYLCNDFLMIKIIMENVNDDVIRKRVYDLYNQSNEYFLQNILTLNYYRNKLAQFRNFPNYSSYALKNCILNTPEKVNYFLNSFLKKILPLFFKELEFIENYIKIAVKKEYAKRKESESSFGSSSGSGSGSDSVLTKNVSTLEEIGDFSMITKLTPYNIHYYMNDIRKKKLENIQEQMQKKLNLYDVIHFVIFLLKNAYSLEMNYIPLKQNEVWDDSIMKFEIKKEQTVYGYIYMDLFLRSNKNSATAQYTVRCSKNMNMCLKYNWMGKYYENAPFFYGGVIKTKDGGKVSYRQITSTFLVCNFVPGFNGKTISKNVNKKQKLEKGAETRWDDAIPNEKLKHLLKETEMSIDNTNNLLHEFGHTIQCIVSSTYLQHLSGNRSGVDFSEFASHFFETYLTNWDSLLLLYTKGGEEEHINVMKPILLEYMKNRKIICYYPLVHTTIQSIIDQIFYSFSAETASISERKRLIEEQINKYFEGIYYKDIFILDLFPQTHFSKTAHLVEYPANYYSYLYCTVAASYVWNKIFEKQLFNKEKANKVVQFLMQGAVDSSLKSIISLVEDDKEMIDLLTDQPHKIPLDPFFANCEEGRPDYQKFLESL